MLSTGVNEIKSWVTDPLHKLAEELLTLQHTTGTQGYVQVG